MTLLACRVMQRSAAATLVALLSGCVWERDAVDAALPPTPAAFRAEPSRAAPSVAGWQGQFGSSELTHLLDWSLSDNFDVAAARARILEAYALARSTAAALYPQLNGTQNAQRTLTSGTSKFAYPPYSSSTSTNYSFGLSASYVLDFFGKNQALAEAAQFNAVASRYDRDVTVVATLASVANTWFNLVAAQDRLRVAAGNIKVAQDVLNALNERVAVGTATALDTSQQENVLATQRASVPPLEQIVEQNRNLLAVLVGQTPGTLSIRGGTLNALKIPRPRAGLPSQLLLRRPDVVSAETRLRAQKASVDAARAAFFPTVNLSASASLVSQALSNILNPQAIAVSLAQGLTQPIFDGGNLQGQLENNQAKETELLEDYRKSIVTAFSDVENALIGERLTAQHEALQKIAVRSARRAYEITQARLREGTIDVVTLLSTQTALFQAEDQLIQVRLQRFLAAVTLYQALGGGFSLDDSPLESVDGDPTAANILPAAVR